MYSRIILFLSNHYSLYFSHPTLFIHSLSPQKTHNYEITHQLHLRHNNKFSTTMYNPLVRYIRNGYAENIIFNKPSYFLVNDIIIVNFPLPALPLSILTHNPRYTASDIQQLTANRYYYSVDPMHCFICTIKILSK